MIIQRELFSRIGPVLDSPEVIIITGMRRVGKTTLLRYIMDKITSDNKVFLDLENPASQKYFEEDNYDKIADGLNLLGLDLSSKGHVFLDEIQFVRNIPSVVKYLHDHYKIKFFLSGSSSFYLKNLFSESLAGRKYIFELFPLSFREFMLLKSPGMKLEGLTSNKVTQAMYGQIERYYNEYILFGGFPGVVQKGAVQEKKAMLEDIFSSYFQLEVVHLGDFKKINIIRDLMLLLMERVGSKLDVQKLSRELGVARDTINNYIAFLENTYFIKLIRPFSRNRDSEVRSAPKFYLCDSGIINQFAKVDAGALLENVIFSALRAKGEVNYYQKKSGVEIDFILDKETAYEVKMKPYSQDVKRLGILSKELGLKKYIIISRKYSEFEHVEYGFNL